MNSASFLEGVTLEISLILESPVSSGADLVIGVLPVPRSATLGFAGIVPRFQCKEPPSPGSRT